MEPTQAQIKEFWGWCGFVSCYKSVAPEETGIDYWMQPPDSEKTIPIPDIDLNNLFKYAPSWVKSMACGLLNEENWKGAWAKVITQTGKTAWVREENLEPKDALFWALHSLIDKTP